jgi:uncharacterized protein YdeI (YjbR/CyaY-like superfamily)
MPTSAAGACRLQSCPTPAAKVRPARGRSGSTGRTGDQAGTEVAVPPDPADALDRDLDARRAIDAVSSSGKHRLVLPVEQAKTAETRRRRIARAVEELRAGRNR